MLFRPLLCPPACYNAGVITMGFEMLKRFILSCLFLLPLLSLGACGTTSTDEEKLPDVPTAQKLFDDGKAALDKDLYQTASKSFDELERQHPYSDLAPQAKLLSAYAHYLNEDYDEAIIGFDQFLQLHPSSEDAPYALYLKAMCYYEQITDVSRDQDTTRKAMEALQLVKTRYPQSDYAKEAALKLDLTRDHLAGKEMEIGRWYQRQDQTQAAIARFRSVVDNYQTTSHVPEALYRLIECYTRVGLGDEAHQTAVVLGQNFPGSPWYQDAYHLIGDATMPSADAEADKPGWFSRTFKDIF